MTTLTKKTKPGIWTAWDDLFSLPLFGEDFRTNKQLPPVNVVEDEKAYHIEFAAPGMTKKDFHINVKDGTLNVWTERTEEKVEEEKNYTRREFNYTAFTRSFSLPEDVNPDEIKARYVDGVLTIDVKRLDVIPDKSKLIEVR